jgi:UDP-GlcNAc3NAcA epimerase
LLTWLSALNEVGARRPILLPLHPRTKKRMETLGKSTADFPNVRFLDPVGYTTMAVLTKHAALVVTDSGGLQKEAYFHKVPGLILRNETEWVELIETGWSRLVDCQEAHLIEAIKNFIPPSPWQADLFGDGRSRLEISKQIQGFLS